MSTEPAENDEITYKWEDFPFKDKLDLITGFMLMSHCEFWVMKHIFDIVQPDIIKVKSLKSLNCCVITRYYLEQLDYLIETYA